MNDILNQIKEFESSALTKLKSADDVKTLDALKIEFLGRKGKLSEFYKLMGEAPTEIRPKLGAELNRIKKAIQDKIEITNEALARLSKKEYFDYTLPVRASFIGHKHPLLQTVDDITRYISNHISRWAERDFIGAIWGVGTYMNIYSELDEGMAEPGLNALVKQTMCNYNKNFVEIVKWEFLGFINGVDLASIFNGFNDDWVFVCKDPPIGLFNYIDILGVH